jgi:hypothetical protein
MIRRQFLKLTGQAAVAATAIAGARVLTNEALQEFPGPRTKAAEFLVDLRLWGNDQPLTDWYSVPNNLTRLELGKMRPCTIDECEYRVSLGGNHSHTTRVPTEMGVVYEGDKVILVWDDKGMIEIT